MTATIDNRHAVSVALWLTDDALRVRLGPALRRAGYLVEVLADVAHLTDDGHRVIVLVFDHRPPRWRRTIADLTHANPRLHPLLLSEIHDEGDLLTAVMAGVDGVCSPSASTAAIVRTVVALVETGAAIPRGFIGALMRGLRANERFTVETGERTATLTAREWQILQALAQDRSTREIGAALFVSDGTVRSHIHALLRKLGAANRAEAVRIAEGRSPDVAGRR